MARGRVEIRHVRGAADASYLVEAFGDELLMQMQLNVHRFYWRTDTVQMTRCFMLEAARCGVRLSPRQAGFPV